MRRSLFFVSLFALLFGSAQTTRAATDSVALNISPITDEEIVSPSVQAIEAIASTPPSQSPIPQSPPPTDTDIALNFAPPPPTPASSSAPSSASPPTPASQIFANGPDSLVARTVGHAEGTRTADGGKTPAYQGHVDPGNRVWNLGSFSFQHCQEIAYNCSTPEEADTHQLRRLQEQADQLQQRATAVGMTMTLEEELNGIDLANQAPAAALGSPGYVEWLKKAKEDGRIGQDVILRARIDSYWEPDLNWWNAPGLGSNEADIAHDQNRRMKAIARALKAYNQEWQQRVARNRLKEEITEQIIAQNLP
jgi:hypothetical protein